MKINWKTVEDKLSNEISSGIVKAMFFGFFTVAALSLISNFIVFVFLCVSGWNFIKSIKKILFAQRGKKYIDVFKEAEDVVDFKTLANYVGKDKSVVKKDLQQMKSMQLLKKVTVDFNNEEVLFKKDDEKAADTQENDTQDTTAKPTRKTNTATKKSEGITAKRPFVLQEGDMADEANALLEQLLLLKNTCKDAEIADKIGELRVGVGKLLTYGYQNKSESESIKRFNRKYLVTVIKLLEKFIEMEQLINDTAAHKSTKEKLVSGLDDLIKAYAVNLEDKYNEDVFDIASDISVIENMLANEGLLDNENTLKMDLDGDGFNDLH